jgi:hypothetical protein
MSKPLLIGASVLLAAFAIATPSLAQGEDAGTPASSPPLPAPSVSDPVPVTVPVTVTDPGPLPARDRGTAAEALAIAAPASTAQGPSLHVEPYLLLSGGLKFDHVVDRPDEEKEDRLSTFALGRLGMRARWLDLVSAESELMASGGIGLHGTSAYEGQAALQVRQQVLRVGRGPWRVDVGRFVDEASVDFFSAHVVETFLQDTATRDPLLYSGFNLGNGVRGQVEPIKGLRLALTLNAGNPVSTTASLMIGGPFPPFERFYTQPYQAVNQGPNHFPDDTFHILMLTPSVLLDTSLVDLRVAAQGFDVNTNMNKGGDDHIRGYNLRATARLKLADSVIVPFASTAYLRNDTLDPNDLTKRAKERYQAFDVGGGVDLNLARRFACGYDCADGFGVQYQTVQFQVGDGLVTTNQYFNVGGTYWIAPNVSLGARVATWLTKQEYAPATGERSAIVALRFIMR